MYNDENNSALTTLVTTTTTTTTTTMTTVATATMIPMGSKEVSMVSFRVFSTFDDTHCIYSDHKWCFKTLWHYQFVHGRTQFIKDWGPYSTNGQDNIDYSVARGPRNSRLLRPMALANRPINIYLLGSVSSRIEFFKGLLHGLGWKNRKIVKLQR